MTDAFQNTPPPLSPLDSVARFFRQFGGGPAPAPPPNLEQQAAAQGEQPDRTPPPDKGPFNWANNALPPGSPMPRPAPFQPFRAASIDRPPEQWGQEEQFPSLPQSFETIPLAQNLSQWFGQNGSIPSSMIAQAMARHPAEFLQGVLKGQQERAREAREQLAFHITELKERQEEEMTRYAEVMSAHGALNETQDPAKMLKPVKGKTLMEDLYDTARDIGDIGRPGTLGDLIASGAKPSEVISFLQARDKRLRDLQKLKATVDEDTAEEAQWGLTPKQEAAKPQGDIGPYSGYQAPGAAAPPTETAAVDPATGQPAPSSAPAPKDKVAGLGAPSDTTAGVEDTKPETPLDAVATDVMRGVEPNAMFAKTHPKEYNAAVLKGYQRRAAAQSLLKNPPKDPSQILPMVKQISPEMASDLGQVLNYQKPASGGTSGTGASIGSPASQYGDLLSDLATLAAGKNPDGTPKWNQGFYQDQQRFRTDVNTQNVIIRSNSLAADGKAILTDLKELERQGVSTTGLNLDGLLAKVRSDPTYAKLAGDWLAYNDAFNTIVTGGRHVESGTMAQVNVAPTAYASPAAFRAAMKGHMNDAIGYLDGEHTRWESIGGKPSNMPSYNPKTEKELHDIRDMDYLTGTLPGETFTNKKGVTKTWKGGSLDPYDTSNWE